MYERYESKVTTHSDGREEIHITREKSTTGLGEFLGAIAFITMCILSGDAPLQFPTPANTNNHYPT